VPFESVLKFYSGYVAEDSSSLKGSVNIARGNALGLRHLKAVALKARFNLDGQVNPYFRRSTVQWDLNLGADLGSSLAHGLHDPTYVGGA